MTLFSAGLAKLARPELSVRSLFSVRSGGSVRSAISVRSVAKLALYGTVLAGVTGGTVAFTHSDKTVLLRVDGQVRTVHTSAADVRGVLSASKISVGSHDLIAPGLQDSVRGGSEIVLQRGHLLKLNLDGKIRSLWVNADSVDEALGQLGVTSNSFVSVSRSKRLDAGVTSLAVYRPKKVSFKVDGQVLTLLSSGPRVENAVADAGIKIGSNDRMSVSGSAVLKSNQVITIQRVRYGQSSENVDLTYKSVTKTDPSTYAGISAVITPGQTGSQQITYQLVYVDGVLSGRVVTDTQTLNPEIDQVTSVGSKKLPAVIPAGTAQQIAAGLVAQRGWDASQFSCLVSLWSKESGWRTNAANSSGAYGIPQALPGGKMSSAGPDWQNNPVTQITWGLNYIAGVYKSPCGAWAHSQSFNWY